ncbi:hypothetical protein DIJ64_10440 [Mycobacterium leprae]|uniref:Uncharacterized protein n=1 Tax=Mycobacterium leprae TaxID=1769 RepID=A0AAD0P971_MYCLR|nr:hypothetical protein [Mycobacterium leprae]AWV48323.1 hypothetical protein DIJ64_10440 [Mycobacterium leprae]OAR20869.1 hypothetical protein A8144_09025 [Mycobacterium leprae 3125609]OAX70989.1 hypothetical protein A3216_08575 [Mycobacterium leprae 7935681]
MLRHDSRRLTRVNDADTLGSLENQDHPSVVSTATSPVAWTACNRLKQGSTGQHLPPAAITALHITAPTLA